ncbi:MAG TPA: hypothetical protein VK154_09340 [Chitinophagales bacterium]|nr:hypothetical protein [Chitinophagales bacterium]
MTPRQIQTIRSIIASAEERNQTTVPNQRKEGFIQLLRFAVTNAFDPFKY